MKELTKIDTIDNSLYAYPYQIDFSSPIVLAYTGTLEPRSILFTAPV